MSPKNKLILASVGLAVLIAAASYQSGSASTVGWAALAFAALAGLCGWWIWARTGSMKDSPAARLSVISRTGLSSRTALALVEVDGRSFLVVHGDGYAEICSTAVLGEP